MSLVQFFSEHIDVHLNHVHRRMSKYLLKAERIASVLNVHLSESMSEGVRTDPLIRNIRLLAISRKELLNRPSGKLRIVVRNKQRVYRRGTTYLKILP